MITVELLITRLQEIGTSLSKTPHALALLGLGSAGIEKDRMDEYSDLDFFVLCEKGYKQRFISNLDWLENVNKISFAFKNTVDGYKLMFKDGVFCEFAIFEPDEMKNIPFSEGSLVWCASDFDSSICAPSKLPTKKTIDTEWTINEALTNLYVGLCRYHRGEKLSAYYFIQNYAFERVLDLIEASETPLNIKQDIFSILRRFEFRYPQSTALVKSILKGYEGTIEAAKEILEFLDSHYPINQSIKNAILELCNRAFQQTH